jgi:alkylresorcinol/alkylpyrone synthase
MTTIAAAASAFPKHYYPQDVLLAAFKSVWAPILENPRILDRLHTAVGVDGRHLSMPLNEYYDLASFGKANNVWIETAKEIGEHAISCALTRAGLTTDDLGAIFFVSVTGIASPSIDARLINRMRLPANIRRVPIFGLGCVAGAAGISIASDYVRAYPDKVAVLLAVELCSLTLQRHDLSIANLISSGLFGDGACAVILAGAERRLAGPRIVATRSMFYPDTEDVMGWDISEKGFNIVLSPSVPDVIRENLGRDVDALLAENGLTRNDIESWVLHTGGPKILEATQDALSLPAGALETSWDCLRRMGNLSSASVLVVLEEFLMKRRPAAGTWGLLAAMGPGFCSELVLLRW